MVTIRGIKILQSAKKSAHSLIVKKLFQFAVLHKNGGERCRKIRVIEIYYPLTTWLEEFKDTLEAI